MSKGCKIIPRGRFKGKKVTLAPTARVEEFSSCADRFMEEVFDFLPGEFLITDESDLADFTEVGSSDTSEIWRRIQEIYDVGYSDVGSERLVDIFLAITQRRSVQ